MHLRDARCPAPPLTRRASPSRFASRSNWLGNRAWANALNWPHGAAFNSTKPTEWKVGGSAAGTVQSSHNFTFLRVYDAGHMVPRDQPANALAMVNAFIGGKL